jgi:phage tail-like protein
MTARRPDEQPRRVQANLNCRYYVSIDGDAYRAVFSEVGGLSLETDVQEYVEGGNNSFVYRLPGVTRTGNISLRRGITRDNELLRWHLRIAHGVVDLRGVQITAFTTDGTPLVTWSVQNAFPVRWTGPQLNAATPAVAVEHLELAHSGVLILG